MQGGPARGPEGVGAPMEEGRRREDRTYQGSDPVTGDAGSWDEASGGGGRYDPSRQAASNNWEAPHSGSQGDHHAHGDADPRYTFAPPPMSYPQYPPPIYAHPYAYGGYYPRPPNPSLPVGGGVLTLISGAMGVLWVALLFGDTFFGLFGFAACFAASLVLSIMAVIGGIMAMMRRMFPVAIIGAVCGMLSGGFFGITFIIGLIGLILIATGKDAFNPVAQQPRAYRY